MWAEARSDDKGRSVRGCVAIAPFGLVLALGLCRSPKSPSWAAGLFVPLLFQTVIASGLVNTSDRDAPSLFGASPGTHRTNAAQAYRGPTGTYQCTLLNPGLRSDVNMILGQVAVFAVLLPAIFVN